MTIRNLSLLLAAMTIFSASAIASEETETQLLKAGGKEELKTYLSNPEFLLQREQMMKDTAAKVKVLQAAHDCAKAADTPIAFAECNQKLRDAILGEVKK